VKEVEFRLLQLTGVIEEVM